MHKEVRELIKWARQFGWSPDRNSDHPILRHPNGAQVTVPGSPSDHRSLANTRSVLLRLAGQTSDSGPAAKYRKGMGRRNAFNMAAALYEQEQREAEQICRLARMIELQCHFYDLADTLAGLNPRLDKVQAIKLAHELRVIKKELKHLGAETPKL